MTDDVHAPTVPDRDPGTSSQSGPAKPPDARYEMRGLLGRGGMGEVWLAHDGRIDRDVAIKVMRGASANDPDAVARFLREARIQGRLEHPAIVPVHDLGNAPGAPYFAMKRVTGTTLADVLSAHAEGRAAAREQWTRRALLARLVDACLAVELAHQRGVIHRDLKPANVMLGDFGETYVLDWGLARIDDGERGIRGSDLGGDSELGHTVAGAMMGTPGFMAPEQVRGESVDARSDVYALGCILFEILTGRPAVPQDTAIESTLDAREHRPSARGAADIAPELDDACARATAADIAARTGSARDLADAIQRFLDGDRDLERRRELAAAHVRRGHGSFSVHDEAGRAEAMREAGRAIALDPENQQAKALLARLLLEPPRHVPSEVRASLHAQRDHAARVLLRKGVAGYGWALAVLVLLAAAGVPLAWPFVAIGVLVVTMMIACGIAGRRSSALSGVEIVVLVSLHALLLGVVSVTGGPLVVAPLVALGSLQVMLLYPAMRMPVFLLVAHLLAIAVPLALEWFGAIPPTFVLVDNSLVLRPWALAVPGPLLVWIVLGIVVIQMTVATVISSGQRATQEAAEERLHVTSWHLSQLVR